VSAAVSHSTFVVKERIGGGAHGVVYRAENAEGQSFAVKFATADGWVPFHKAVEYSKRIDSAAVASHLEVAIIESPLENRPVEALVMELVRGISLAHLIIDRKPITNSWSRQIGLDVIEGLRAIHAAGLVHLNMHTANVMVATSCRAKLIDFGSIKETSRPGELQQDLTSLRYTLQDLLHLAEPGRMNLFARALYEVQNPSIEQLEKAFVGVF
jgi:eukaryotic-like serine/threonine-protein kinase